VPMTRIGRGEGADEAFLARNRAAETSEVNRLNRDLSRLVGANHEWVTSI
jgi:hypothetical protein